MAHLVSNLYSVGALLLVIFLCAAALAPLIGQLLKGAHPPLRYVPREDALRDTRARLAEDIQSRAHHARVLPMWDTNAQGWSIPRLTRADSPCQPKPVSIVRPSGL